MMENKMNGMRGNMVVQSYSVSYQWPVVLMIYFETEKPVIVSDSKLP